MKSTVRIMKVYIEYIRAWYSSNICNSTSHLPVLVVWTGRIAPAAALAALDPCPPMPLPLHARRSGGPIVVATRTTTPRGSMLTAQPPSRPVAPIPADSHHTSMQDGKG